MIYVVMAYGLTPDFCVVCIKLRVYIRSFSFSILSWKRLFELENKLLRYKPGYFYGIKFQIFKYNNIFMNDLYLCCILTKYFIFVISRYIGLDYIGSNNHYTTIARFERFQCRNMIKITFPWKLWTYTECKIETWQRKVAIHWQ